MQKPNNDASGVSMKPSNSDWKMARRLLRLAMPISISLGVGSSISLIDSLLVAPLGATALAAIALGGV